MLAKLKSYIRCCATDIKGALLANRAIFYICLACTGLGLLLALGQDYSDATADKNFIVAMLSGATSPIPQLLRIILWITVAYVVVFLTAFHFFAFVCLGFGGFVVGAFLLFQNAFAVISVNALCGFLYLILYLLPTLVVCFACLVCTIQELYSLLGYAYNRKCLVNIGCQRGSIWKTIKPFYLFNLLSCLTYWLIFYLILLLFCR